MQALSLGLTAEATSLRLMLWAPGRFCRLLPRLNCRGNFVEATSGQVGGEAFTIGLGLTAEATSLRPPLITPPTALIPVCLGLTAEATSLRQPRGHRDHRELQGLGLTAEATSLRPDT